MRDPAFDRNERLVGRSGVAALAQTRVILFGVGGVGSWCAEALIRSGVGHLTIVDNDVVCVTHINRQLQATRSSLGKPKVEALRERLRNINPRAEIVSQQQAYDVESCERFELETFDYVIDTIDALAPKVDLIAQAMCCGVPLYSAMGAASKLDPTNIRVDSIWKSKGCRLAHFMRKRLRQKGAVGECLCVYSEEPCVSAESEAQDELVSSDAWCEQQASVHGSMVHLTGSFGFFLAGLVVQDVCVKRPAKD